MLRKWREKTRERTKKVRFFVIRVVLFLYTFDAARTHLLANNGGRNDFVRERVAIESERWKDVRK